MRQRTDVSSMLESKVGSGLHLITSDYRITNHNFRDCRYSAWF